ncbi:MAG TPA: nucleoside triphosphate pyrophosphohydrolase [Bryobacteraceae bacterium]|nr:nucleoside triphosphate pyrophosphohydrolase [Bryobacteraceae bacterium]
MSKDPQSQAAAKFERLTELMALLRAPGGCPWDRKQTFDSIKPYLLEETYEVLDAIDARDWDSLREELGDLMLQAVFFAQMAREEGRFGIEDSLDAINEKLVRRHPHVFGTGTAETPEDVKRRWDEIKAEEKKELGREPAGLLDAVPRSTPALVEAAQIASRAAGVGFDWPDVQGVLDKLDEELSELAQARASNASHEEVEGEIGDLLFVIVNLARFLKVDPEQALRRTNRKFRARFGHVERELKQAGKAPAEATLEEMETLWQAAKRKP